MYIYINELSSVDSVAYYNDVTLLTYVHKIIAGFVEEIFNPFWYTLIYITSFLFDTAQTTPGPSQNMDYITQRCRDTTCHECTVSNQNLIKSIALVS